MSSVQTTRTPRPARLRANRRMSIGIVGGGRVGAVLGAGLARAGYPVRAASGLSAASTARLAQLLPTTAVVPPDQVPAGVDIVLLAVPDDALPGIARGLADAGVIEAGQVVIHTCGAHGLAVLDPVVAVGARPIALHPAMTFTGAAGDLDRLAAGISFGVTAPVELRPLATRLVAYLGGSIEWIAEENRPLYHAALAHGANHLSTLVNEAMDRLRDAGIRQPAQVLAPLLQASLANTLAFGDAALTGPIARGDAGTVAKHLATLLDAAPDSVPVYRALARRTADRAIASGRLRPVDAEPLLGVLAHTVPAAHPELAAGERGAG